MCNDRVSLYAQICLDKATANKESVITIELVAFECHIDLFIRRVCRIEKWKNRVVSNE